MLTTWAVQTLSDARTNRETVCSLWPLEQFRHYQTFTHPQLVRDHSDTRSDRRHWKQRSRDKTRHGWGNNVTWQHKETQLKRCPLYIVVIQMLSNWWDAATQWAVTISSGLRTSRLIMRWEDDITMFRCLLIVITHHSQDTGICVVKISWKQSSAVRSVPQDF